MASWNSFYYSFSPYDPITKAHWAHAPILSASFMASYPGDIGIKWKSKLDAGDIT